MYVCIDTYTIHILYDYLRHDISFKITVPYFASVYPPFMINCGMVDPCGCWALRALRRQVSRFNADTTGVDCNRSEGKVKQ